MTPIRLIATIIFSTLISSGLLITFYLLQRDFTANYKEFTLLFSKLESKELQIKHSILQNTLLAYQNHDLVARHTNELEQIYTQTIQSAILKDATYKQIKNKLLDLQETLNVKLSGIEDQLMLNTAISNSLLFLSTQLHQLCLNSPQRMKTYAHANKILKRFKDASLMQDLDYISDEGYRLQNVSDDQELQNFVNNFNLHTEYLNTNFAQFIISTKYILNDTLTQPLEEIQILFKDLAIKDFRTLDLLALLLFSIFASAVFVIILLTVKYFRENNKLLEMTYSLEHSISHDQLTGLLNRNSFSNKLMQLKQPHLLLLNIDSFKDINDIYGNNVGNRLLQSLTHFITEQLKEKDYIHIYRTGGDEFGILFDGIEEQKALEIAKQLQESITKHTFALKHRDIEISVSIASNNIDPIIENADLALKYIKQDLTQRVIAFQEDLNLKTNVKENLKTIDMIKHAIQEDRVVPYFQPIINLQESKIQKYEALVRIELKNGTVVSPYLFLQTAKKTPYYHDITSIMLQKTIAMAKEYPQYRFSINISMIDILNSEIRNMILEKLTENFGTASRIDIELLESEHIHDIEKVQEFICKLHSLGAYVLLDDFGAGYSNFSYFSDLDIDLVKVDGSIVKEIVQDERKLHMLQSIYNFSQGLRLENIAEFVETKEIAQILQQMGVKYAQGYYFGEPRVKPLEDDIVSF